MIHLGECLCVSGGNCSGKLGIAIANGQLHHVLAGDAHDLLHLESSQLLRSGLLP